MKTILRLVALFLVTSNITNAQAPNWSWAQDPGSGAGNGLSTDPNGHLYVTGYFDAPFINFGNTTLMNDGSYSAFLTKYDASGNVIWAISGGGGGALSTYEGQAVCTDVAGNVFMAGNFSVADMIIGNDTLVFPGNGDNIFIAKCDSSGNVLWARSVNSLVIVECNGISSDIYGNVYVTGYFSGPNIIFGSDTLTFIGNYNNAINSFIVKYDVSGNVVWAKNAGSNSRGVSVCTDAGSYVYLSGGFSGPGKVIFGSDTLTYIDRKHSFLVKYDSVGNVVWAKGTCADGAVSADMTGNIYIAGSYDSIAIFGSDTLVDGFGFDSLINMASYSVFLAKYDTSGNVIWAKSSGLSENAEATAKSTDAQGNSYVTGVYSSPGITFGTDTLIYTNSDTGGAQIFVAKYDTSGRVVWAKSIDGGTPYPNLFLGVNSTISTDANGNSYFTGWFSTPDLAFDNITLNYLQSANNRDIFVAKLGAFATGITTIKNSDKPINVYPNPSTSTFNFTGLPADVTIQVHDVLGGLIYTSITDGDNCRINLNRQAKGIYFYRVMDKGNVIGQGKIILE